MINDHGNRVMCTQSIVQVRMELMKSTHIHFPRLVTTDLGVAAMKAVRVKFGNDVTAAAATSARAPDRRSTSRRHAIMFAEVRDFCIMIDALASVPDSDVAAGMAVELERKR